MLRTKTEYLQEVYGTEDDSEIWKMRIDEAAAGNALRDGSNKLELPYEAPNHPIIPSLEEMRSAIHTHSIKHSSGIFPVFRFGPCVIKAGDDHRILQEAENMLYLEKHTEVRTAKVYAVFRMLDHYEDYTANFLVTEFLEGESMTLEKFNAMEKKDQDIIIKRLSEQLRLLRSVKQEGDEYYGRVHYQGWSTTVPGLRIRELAMRGPYDTHDDFLSALYKCAEHTWAIRPGDSFTTEQCQFLADIKSVLGKSKATQPVLTNLDIKWTNIIARPIIDSADGKTKDWEVTMIDWDTLGWAPAYLQSVVLDEWFGESDEIREQILAYCGGDQYDTEREFLYKHPAGYSFSCSF